jgi:hypothetical protein
VQLINHNTADFVCSSFHFVSPFIPLFQQVLFFGHTLQTLYTANYLLPKHEVEQ